MRLMSKILVAASLALSVAMSPVAVAKDDYTIGFSHYTGWEPWAYIHEYGVMDKWNKKMGVNIRIEFFNDYGESLNSYTAGMLDGVTATNMDALMAPAAGGIVSTVLINGDYSNGNDALAVRGAATCDNIRGREILLLEGSVSHYLLSRYLDECNMTEDDVRLSNTSDADIATVYLTSRDTAVVTWNPPLQQVMSNPDTSVVFNSSQIPGEILDSLYVRADMSDNAKKALVGAWYEAMTIMSAKGRESREMVNFMAEYSGATPNEFRAQMRTTAFFITPQQAIDFTNSDDLKSTMDRVRSFIFDRNLFSGNVTSKDFIGIQFPDGTVMGDPSRVRIIFDTSYTQLAADGKL